MPVEIHLRLVVAVESDGTPRVTSAVESYRLLGSARPATRPAPRVRLDEVFPKPASTAKPPERRGGRQPKPLLTKTCACGCGGMFQTKNPDRMWLPGHNPKHGRRVKNGHVRSPEISPGARVIIQDEKERELEAPGMRTRHKSRLEEIRDRARREELAKRGGTTLGSL